MKRKLKEEAIALYLLESKMHSLEDRLDLPRGSMQNDEDSRFERAKEWGRQKTGFGHGKHTSDWEDQIKPEKRRSRQAQFGGEKVGAPPQKFTPDTSYTHGRYEKPGKVAGFFGAKPKWTETKKG